MVEESLKNKFKEFIKHVIEQRNTDANVAYYKDDLDYLVKLSNWTNNNTTNLVVSEIIQYRVPMRDENMELSKVIYAIKKDGSEIPIDFFNLIENGIYSAHTYFFQTKEEVIDFLKDKFLSRLINKNFNPILFWERDVDIFFSDGYNDPSWRTVFFCVKGSPNKLSGYIKFSGHQTEETTGSVTSTMANFKFKYRKPEKYVYPRIRNFDKL